MTMRNYPILHLDTEYSIHEHNSYPKMSVTWFLTCSWVVLLLLSIKATSGHLCRFNVIWCIEFYFPDTVLSTRKKGICEVILQMLVIIVYVDLLKIQRFDNTVKSAHAVTCVEMSPISCSVIIFFFEFEPLKRSPVL